MSGWSHSFWIPCSVSDLDPLTSLKLRDLLPDFFVRSFFFVCDTFLAEFVWFVCDELFLLVSLLHKSSRGMECFTVLRSYQTHKHTFVYLYLPFSCVFPFSPDLLLTPGLNTWLRRIETCVALLWIVLATVSTGLERPLLQMELTNQAEIPL